MPSLGLYRGILCIWNPTSFCASSCSVAMNGRILHLEGVFSHSNLDCLVSFVYALNDGSLKKELWDYLVNFKDSVGKPWCLIGDFIETIFPSNRKGGSLISFSITSSKNWTDYCELVELPLNGKKFTWSRGNAVSRIDRMFMSIDWLQLFPSSTLYRLPKYSSDYRLIHLLLDSMNWGPKPFQFMNCWWLLSNFRKVLQVFWITNFGKRNVASALRLLKESCKQWSKDVVGNTNSKIKALELEADSLYSKKQK